MKIRVGILFGGNSREREISFAGGRTVYDNLNKSIFEPIPLFVDSFGKFCLLKWEYIYKGSIRDFYPPVDFIPPSEHGFQVYAESLGDLSGAQQRNLLASIGEPISTEQLKKKIDFAFLCLHGASGEDGRIQGLLEYMGIPYSGSGILSSSIGMNKAVQKELMKHAGFQVPVYDVISRREWLSSTDKSVAYQRILTAVKIPFVLKPSNQGSSIGAAVMTKDDLQVFISSVNKSFFIREIDRSEWAALDWENKVEFVRDLCDIRDGIGLPLTIDKNAPVFHPEELLKILEEKFSSGVQSLTLTALEGESEVLAESFIEGKEFSCIVIRNENESPIALPPTEIRKGKEVYDYRSKYLPGLSRKITPIEIPDEQIERIGAECEKLFLALKFNVYARIDGFIKKDGTIFLNDPNTTSGMLPSSFFFHQAAEIGLNPSQFLTFIIRQSLAERINDFKKELMLDNILETIDRSLKKLREGRAAKKKIAVLLGGYSFERHISVESGRNVYEKLSSSEKYEPVPVFVSGNAAEHFLYQIPVNILLKDNADDINEKIKHSEDSKNGLVHKVIQKIIQRCSPVTSKYSSSANMEKPSRLSYQELASRVEGVFIALHGRPGEDGEVQRNLEKVGLPYNGSGPSSSEITIDKYRTNELLKENGMLVARHALAQKAGWIKNPATFFDSIKSAFTFPFIAKPVDDGCSAAVRKIRNEKELIAFASLIFRDQEVLEEKYALTLDLKPKEEFPMKDRFLLEELISSNGAKHFIEITGGMLTGKDKLGAVNYEVFEPSEALSEGDVLSLEEKFLAGEGQNITPARFSKDPKQRELISTQVKKEFEKAAKVLNIEGYARIDAFVRIFEDKKPEVIFIEVNSLPGMTPATCIFHQAAIDHYKPYEFIDQILEYGILKSNGNKELEKNNSL